MVLGSILAVRIRPTNLCFDNPKTVAGNLSQSKYVSFVVLSTNVNLITSEALKRKKGLKGAFCESLKIRFLK